MISIDYEGHKVQPGLLTPPIVCGASVRTGYKPTFLKKKMCIPEMRAILLSGETVCGMRICYDFGCAVAEDPSLLPLVFDKYTRGQVHDIGIAMVLHLIALGCVHDQWLWDPRTGQKLKNPHTGADVKRVSLEVCVDLCLGRIDAKKNDRFRTSYALLENIPYEQWPEDAIQYPQDDVANGLEVAEWQVKNCKNLHEVAAQSETEWALHLSSIWGVRTNPGRVAALEKELAAKLEDDVKFGLQHGLMKQEFYKTGDRKGQIKSTSLDTKAVIKRVTEAYARAGQTPPVTESGGVSRARETLESSGDEILERWAEVSNTVKRWGTYLPVLKQAAECPLNQRANTLLANGRVSYDGIIQTMERKGPIRACFEARDGYKWSSVDWSAAEMSGLGQVCIWTIGESRLAEVLRKKMDPHALFAAEMSMVTYEYFLDKMKTTVAFKDLRQATKTADFGFNGMMGEATFVLQKRREKMEGPDGKPISIRVCQLMHTAPRCSEEMITVWKDRTYSPMCKACVLAAKDLKTFYMYRMWFEMPKYFRWITAMLEKQDWLEQFVSKRIRGGLHGPAAANTLFSGLVADMAKWALRKMTRECYLEELKSPLFGSRIVLFQHDESILEIPDHPKYGTQTQAADRQAEIHREAGMLYCPDCPPDAEPALMKIWYKDAKMVRNDKGELQAWEPKSLAA